MITGKPCGLGRYISCQNMVVEGYFDENVEAYEPFRIINANGVIDEELVDFEDAKSRLSVGGFSRKFSYNNMLRPN